MKRLENGQIVKQFTRTTVHTIERANKSDFHSNRKITLRRSTDNKDSYVITDQLSDYDLSITLEREELYLLYEAIGEVLNEINE